MEKVSLCMRILKIGVSLIWKNDLAKEIIDGITDTEISRLETFWTQYISGISDVILLEDEEMEKQNVPKQKRMDIRENIQEFIQKVEMEKIAERCHYNDEMLGKVLAEEYRNFYEQDMEYDYIYHQRILYSLAKYAMDKIKNKKNFDVEIIIGCYDILIKLQEQQVGDRAWKTNVEEMIRKLLMVFEEKPKSPFEQIVDSLPERKNSNSPFHYLYADIDIYGRGEELQLLEDFIESPSKLLFWGILGPGGIGKSKLAYSFLQKNANNLEWKMVFLPSNKIKDILALTNWDYPQNLLLVIDYAGTVAKELGEWIQKMAAGAEFRTKKIRLLFLERQGYRKIVDSYTYEEQYIAPEWYEQLCIPSSESIFTDKESVQEYQYLLCNYPFMLTLKSLTIKAYSELIDNYASVVRAKQLNDKEKLKILEFIETELHMLKENNSIVTPLYILFVTDAALNGKTFRTWNAKKLMQYVYDRDYFIWESRIRDEQLLCALMEILIYTTIVREWEFGKMLSEPLNDAEHVVNNYRMRGKKDWAYEWTHILTGRINDKSFVPVMGALEPDLVGEYFVLKRFECRNDENLRKWCKLLLETPSVSKEFFIRCIQDYGKEFWQVLLNILSCMNIVLLENQEDSAINLQVEVVALLWLEYYKNVLPLRSTEPRKRIKEFSEKWREHSQEVAELYTIVFYRNETIRGSQKKSKYEILTKLYGKWPDSKIIADNYVDILGTMVKYYYNVGYIEKGNEVVKILQRVIDKWGTNNEEIAVSCANALGKIIPMQYETGDRKLGLHNVEVLSDLLMNWKNENFALYFIVVQGEMAIAQNEMGEKMECEQTLRALCETIRKWGNKGERVAWRAIDTMVKVFICIHTKMKREMRKNILRCMHELARGSFELSKGVIWHCTKALDRIAVIETVTFEELEYIELVQKECYENINWTWK